MNQIVAPPRFDGDRTMRAVGRPLSSDDFHARVAAVANDARRHAVDLDHDDAFPSTDVAALAEAGLLAAPLPRSVGGRALGLEPETMHDLARVLITIGGGNLPLGRLYEGHVNAVRLVVTYGRSQQIARIAGSVRAGHMLAVWNTEVADGVRLCGRGAIRELRGRKVFASGAGHIAHPLITARDDDGALLMVIPTVTDVDRADLSGWKVHGMRASASGAVDFTGLPISDDDIFGGPDDFHCQPLFSAGAWRFAAVQTGGIGAVFDAARAHLREIKRVDDPHQRARMGRAALAVQSARQWVMAAARIADDPGIDAAARVAHVNLARTAVERAGLDVLEFAQRSVGLAGFSRAHPLEKLSRDLATYLRQPNPDKALDDAAAFVLGTNTPVLDIWP